jgi:hypothetical protein
MEDEHMSAKDTTTRHLAEFGDIHPEGETLSIDDVEGLQLTIKGYNEQKGDFGVYAMIYAVDPNGVDVVVRTGARLILAALRGAKEHDAFPVVATFKKRGLAWICE